MDHKTLEAKATTTDVGEFTAIAAAYSVDRTNERIVPGAFKGTITAWQESGKKIPLHWDHSADAKDIIGSVDPSSMSETEDGLQVKGNLDLKDSEVAREAWRSMKAGRVGLSFGYMVTEDSTGSDGVRELKALDVFEITVTPAPANPDTRFIGLKSVKEMSSAEMKAELLAMRRRINEALEALGVKQLEPDGAKEVTEPVEDRKEEEVIETQLPRQDPVNAKLRTEVLKARASAV